MWDNYRLLNFVTNTLLVAVAAAVLYVLAQHDGMPRFLPLKEVHIQGMHSPKVKLEHVSRQQIERVVNEVQGNFLTLDLVAVRNDFLRIPWVRDAKIERAWPLGLNIKLEEHQVLAHWGTHALVNTYGEVFRVVLDEELPVFTAPMEINSQEIARRFRQFNEALAPLQQSIAGINLSSRHAWRLHLDTGTILELGRYEIEKRLMRYVSVYNHSIAHLNQEEALAYVDLRYPNGFAVYLPEHKPPLKNKHNTRKET
ncbi:cell division protein FtsQ/DivIB [Nitrosomonas aestuarii]|uniref:cell division protein FtsQ/DivIB n=1 Tax=Nitrosomonas aestuarii TaxID=52441 RepID=UPI000D319CBF|nr:cell division protein FtsQ/DivIB [Nitrosomonas aestuarii]PTN11119.1 cell division protein FtsQ [Nitrosomonas aestuarii]